MSYKIGDVVFKRDTGIAFVVRHVGEDYIFGTAQGRPDALGYWIVLDFNSIYKNHQEMTVAQIEEKLGYPIKIVK